MKFSAPLALFALAGSAIAQSGDRITIRDNEVIAVKFDKTINAKNTRRGDRFTATVDGDRHLPSGTKLIGNVVDIQRKDGNRKAFAELDFTQIQLPNGQRVEVDAYPVPLNDRSSSRDRGRRTEAKKETRRDHVVLGTAVGGLILGSLIKKPFEGTIIGVLGGILVAETDVLNTSGEVIVDKGQRMGASFEREVSIDWRGRDGYDDRDNRYDPEQDRNRDRERETDRDRDRDRGGEVRGDLLIEFEDRALRFGSGREPFREGSTVMVPLADMADQLGLTVSRTAERAFYLEDEDNTLKLEQNKTEARLNGKRLSMPRAMIERDGVTYVPIEIFAAIKRDSLYVNGSRVSADRT